MESRSDSQQEADTLLEVILHNCEKYADKTALHWVNEDCNVTEHYTYAEVKERTREIAAGLQQLLKEGPKTDPLTRERVILCYPPGLEFLLVFIASLRAGLIPVPVSPPNPSQSQYTAENLLRIIHDSGASFILTSSEFYHDTTMLEFIATSPVPWHCEVTTELIEYGTDHGSTDNLCKIKPNDIALLQYTSGSTGHPKGVMVTHENLLHNSHLTKAYTDADSSLVEISFIPHFHDMGLVTSYLQTLYIGGKGYFMAPSTYIQNPTIWIQAFSKFKGTHGKAPNFTFELILKRPLPKQCNLSSVKCISNGSVMVLHDTIQRFEKAFAPFGLKKNTIRPAYGLAEHTVALCAVHNEDDPLIINGRLSCGTPLLGVVIKIVDPDTSVELPDGEEGEIWVDSASKALGYWEKEEETQKTFEAELDDFSDRTYLRTGDLGLMKDGELIVVGRKKDLIVIRGRNLHPIDIEEKVESSFKVLRTGRTVAFQYDVNRESDSVGYVAELRLPTTYSQAELMRLSSNIAATISLDFQVSVSLVVFIQPKTMPRTTSGKRQRSKCKQLLMKGSLQEVFRWTPGKQQPQSSKPLIRPPVEIRISEDLSEVPMEVDERESQCSPMKQSSLKVLSSKDHLQTLPTFTERRRSAPPLPKDPKARISEQFRRKSVTEKRSGIRRTASDQAHSRRNSLQTLTNTISSVLGVNIQPESNLWAHGCNSIKATELSKRLQSEFGFAIEPHLLFTHQTPMALLAKLQRSLLSMGSPPELLKDNTKKEDSRGDEEEQFVAPMRSRAFSAESSLARKFSLMNVRTKRRSETLLALPQSVKETRANGHESKDDSIAILGMSCSFPGCSNTTEFWDLLMSKTMATTSHTDPSSGETFNGGFTPATGTFDRKWFGVSEWEASNMDPQQYMLLHSAWECLHHARCVPVSGDKDWGVFVGIGTETATSHNGSQSPKTIPPATSVSTSVAANRLARFFNFTGPIQSIDTACASSLSALDSACMYLTAGKCSAALVCGVNILLDPYQFAVLKKMGMLSPDEKTRTFDKLANGYVRGEGCGSILLMPLAQARKEGRRVLAVIRSTATNNNGAFSATMTAPSVEAQTKLLKTALSSANLDPEAIQYIEAHGTGTKVGDLIEADALCSMVGRKSRSKLYNPPVVGGCKANIGHLETASGMASLIKTVLVLEHAQAPGNAGFLELNSSYANKHEMCVSPECKYLNGDTDLSTALVNSFGFGGTNATTILQQYKSLPHLAHVKCHLLFSTFSSKPSSTSYSYLKELTASVNFFKLKFPILQEALISCEEALQKVSDRLKLNTRSGEYQKDAAVFKLCYALAVLLQSLDVEISLVGATDYMGEIVALVTTGALNLPDAATLLLSVPNQSSIMQVSKSFQTPRLPIQSCTGMLYYPSMWQNDESQTKYLKELVSTGYTSQRKSNNLGHGVTEMTPMQEGQVQPIMCITVDRHTPLLTLGEDGVRDSDVSHGVFIAISDIMKHISVRSIQDQSSKDKMQYLREKFLELRDTSDRMSYDGCADKPLKMTEKMLPTFYQKYPLRAMIDSQVPMPADSGARASRRKQSTLSTASSISVGDESGYITQANSAESLNALVPSNLLDMHTLTSMTLSLNLTERAFTNSSPKQSTAEEKKWQVVSAITEEFQETFSSMNLTLEEIANTGLFQLGLNSLKLMQLADLLMKKFDVDMNISDIIEYETLGEIAKAVVEESRIFIASSTSPILKAVAESTELDVYPHLTKVDYYTLPPMEVIRATEPQEDGSLIFRDFAIGRNGVKIVFQGETDISDLSLDKLVHIQGQQVILCNDPGQPKSVNLNKPSLIYFDLHSTTSENTLETCTSILHSNATLHITTWKYDCVFGVFVIEVNRFY